MDSEDKKGVIANVYEDATKSSKYAHGYIAVDIKTGTKRPVINQLVMIAEQRAFDAQQIDYKDRFSVFNALDRKTSSSYSDIEVYLCQFEALPTFVDKLRYLCELPETTLIDSASYESLLVQVPLEYRNYIQVLGPSRSAAFSYRRVRVKEEYERLFKNQISEDRLSNIIYNTFEVGNKYKKSDIKNILADIYNSLGIKDTPKANVLDRFFDIKEVKLNNKETKKRDKAFEILSVKTQD